MHFYRSCQHVSTCTSDVFLFCATVVGSTIPSPVDIGCGTCFAYFSHLLGLVNMRIYSVVSSPFELYYYVVVSDDTRVTIFVPISSSVDCISLVWTASEEILVDDPTTFVTFIVDGVESILVIDVFSLILSELAFSKAFKK